MLALDSGLWTQLRHGYGSAENVPHLLRQLSANSEPKRVSTDEPWFSLWSALCHQGDVYSASYAATPHIVRIAVEAAGPIDLGFFLLPACVEVARLTGHGPPVPHEISTSYKEALRELHRCAFVHADDDWDSDMAQSVAAALAVAKGQVELAQALINLDKNIISRINAGEW